MHVGGIWVKQGLAKAAPRLYARQIAVAFEPLALVDRLKTGLAKGGPAFYGRQVGVAFGPLGLVDRLKALAEPPVASSTACAAWPVIAPGSRSRTTMPRGGPSMTPRSSISRRASTRQRP